MLSGGELFHGKNQVVSCGDIQQPFKWDMLFHKQGRLSAGVNACLFTSAHDGKWGDSSSLISALS
jgi:hypothetical protein